MSKLIVNTGTMFGGKSTELQRLGERHLLAGQKVCFFKPQLDTRYSDKEIVTHNGNKVAAIAIPRGESIIGHIPDGTEVVLLDEVQFFDKNIIQDIWALLEIGMNIYVAGLDMDFKGRAFVVVKELMTFADEVKKFHAVCEVCGEDAVHTGKRSVQGDKVLELGEKNLYMPLCRECYFDYMNQMEGV